MSDYVPSVPNTDLLPMRLHGNQFQLRKQLHGRRVEVGLGTKNKALARERAKAIVAGLHEGTIQSEWVKHVEAGMRPKGWLRVMAINVRSRHKKKGGNINLETLHAVALRSGGRCEVSGMEFRFGEPRHPFSPSVDRIECGVGYEAHNVRLVCLAVNYCMHQWGDAVFLQIAAAMIKKHADAILTGKLRVKISEPLVNATAEIG